jgi:alkane 1-monooxygenase
MNAKTPDELLQNASKKRSSKWKDPKRYKWLLSPALPVIGIAAMSAYAIAPKRLRALAWTGPALVHGVIPALDRLIGEDTSNPPDDAIADLENDPYYNIITKAFIPSQYIMTMLGCYLATRDNVPMSDRIGLTVSVGALNGIAIVTGHELGHKHERDNRIGAMLALAPTFYTHFAVEHNFGHHKRVSTPEDPASSRMGESFWKFLPRTVIGGFKSAVEIETKRLERKGKSFWCLENELLQGWAISAGFLAANVLVSGPRAVPFMLAQGAYGASLLEVINYIEHYGLLREKDENGKYERTQPEHSWNSNYVVTNLVLYQLQRHSDHHAFPSRSFQALRDFPEAPQLPGGYASMLLPAYIPGWWTKVMDERVIRHYKGDLDKINWDPERKDELKAQYKELAEKIAAEFKDGTLDAITADTAADTVKAPVLKVKPKARSRKSAA